MTKEISKTRLDYFVDFLDSKSKSPIKKAYQMTVSHYVVKNKHEELLEQSYNEVMYYYLTDLLDGCEISILSEGFKEELEHLKDVIAFNTSKTVLMALGEKCKSMLIHTDTKLKNIDKIKHNHIKRFIYISLSYLDNRYIGELINHMVEIEEISPDDILSFINKRVMSNEIKTLKI